MTAVDCETCREALSARMDGEAEPAPTTRTDQHLASCAACRSWQARATALSRALRVREATPVPDLSELVLDTAVPPLSTRGWWARIALIAVAAAQVGLALSQMLGVGVGHGGVPDSGHVLNESVAWNLALGMGLLWSALRSRLTSGLIPVLGGFVALLAVYSVHDLATGAVSVSRVVQHGLLVVALGLLVVINRWYSDPAPHRGDARHDDAHHDDAVPGPVRGAGPDAESGDNVARGTRRRGLRPAGRHRAA